MTFPAFKPGDSALSGSNGGFDFHTPPPCDNRHRHWPPEEGGVVYKAHTVTTKFLDDAVIRDGFTDK